MKKYLIFSLLTFFLFISNVFAKELDNGVFKLTIDKDTYNWHEKIHASLDINNVYDEEMTVVFSGSCFLKAKITSTDIDYLSPKELCLGEGSKVELQPDDLRFFTYDLELKDLAGMPAGEYSFELYTKPAIYVGTTLYSKETIQTSQPFTFAGNVSMDLFFKNTTREFNDNEKIEVKYQILNTGERIYNTKLDACNLFIEIYDYYTKKIVYKPEKKECTTLSEEIMVAGKDAYESAYITAYDPEELGKLKDGLYTIIIKLNDEDLAPKSNFSEPFKINAEKTLFSDITGHWGEEFIYKLFENGIINGYSDGTFKPDQTISKAEFVKIALNALNIRILNPTEIPEKTFLDVNENDWFFKFIETAIHKQIIQAESQYLNPNLNIRRRDAFKIIFNTLTDQNTNTKFYNIFNDINKDDENLDVFMTLYNLGVIKGYAGTPEVKPDNTLTRAEASKIALKAREIATNNIITNNKNTLLRYYKYPINLETNSESDIIVCESGKTGFYEFNPDSKDGGQYFETTLNEEQINELLSKLYQNSFFENTGVFSSCTDTSCENINENLTYYYSNTYSQASGNALIQNVSLGNLISEIKLFFDSMKSNQNIQKVNTKESDKFFGENFCLD